MYSLYQSKLFGILFAFLITLSFITGTTSLHAMGFGKTDEVFEYGNTTWNGFYFELDGLNVRGYIPNYANALLENGDLSLLGSVGEDCGYIISTSFHPSFMPPKSAKKFASLVKEENPNYVVQIITPNIHGVKYIAELRPLDPDDQATWRILCTKDRVIIMGTSDTSEDRRLYFFDSLSIH